MLFPKSQGKLIITIQTISLAAMLQKGKLAGKTQSNIKNVGIFYVRLTAFPAKFNFL